MAVAAAPVLPAALVSVTLKVSVPSGNDEILMPVTFEVAVATLPLPVTAVPPPGTGDHVGERRADLGIGEREAGRRCRNGVVRIGVGADRIAARGRLVERRRGRSRCRPVLPAALVSVTLKVSVPSGNDEMLMPVTS